MEDVANVCLATYIQYMASFVVSKKQCIYYFKHFQTVQHQLLYT